MSRGQSILNEWKETQRRIYGRYAENGKCWRCQRTLIYRPGVGWYCPSCNKPRRTGFIAEYFCPACGTTTTHRVMGTSPYRKVRTCITCGLTI